MTYIPPLLSSQNYHTIQKRTFQRLYTVLLVLVSQMGDPLLARDRIKHFHISKFLYHLRSFCLSLATFYNRTLDSFAMCLRDAPLFFFPQPTKNKISNKSIPIRCFFNKLLGNRINRHSLALVFCYNPHITSMRPAATELYHSGISFVSTPIEFQ